MGVDTNLLILGHEGMKVGQDHVDAVNQVLSSLSQIHVLGVYACQEPLPHVSVSLDVRWRSRYRAWIVGQMLRAAFPGSRIIAINDHEEYHYPSLKEFIAAQELLSWEEVNDDWVRKGAIETGTLVHSEAESQAGVEAIPQEQLAAILENPGENMPDCQTYSSAGRRDDWSGPHGSPYRKK